jgi:phenylpyruvate tautomerase PptA (4-oxalocrotonate tautomerase family)
MPTIRIQAIAPGSCDIGQLLTRCTAAAADALGIPQHYCWAIFQPVAPGAYAEGNCVWSASEAGRAAPLISITALEGRTAELKAAVLQATAGVVAESLAVPIEQVFAEYRDIPKGQAFSGGGVC